MRCWWRMMIACLAVGCSGPQITRIDSSDQPISAIAADRDAVFWLSADQTSAPSIRKASRSDDNPTLFFQSPQNLALMAIAVDDTNVYAVGNEPEEVIGRRSTKMHPVVFAIPRAGGPVAWSTGLDCDCTVGPQLSIDDTGVYFVVLSDAFGGWGSGTHTIVRVPKGGGAAERLWSSSALFVESFAVSHGNVYFVTENGRVNQVRTTGDEASVVATPDDLYGVASVAVAADADDLFVWTTTGIVRVPLDGGAPLPITALPPPAPRSILAVDGDDLFFSRGQLLSVHRDGTAMRVLVDKPWGAATFAVTPRDVYFVGALDGTTSTLLARVDRTATH